MKKFLIYLIRCYQRYISTYTKSSCIYVPTCSSYAIEAIDRFGAFKGLVLTLCRFLRCNPFSKGGYDPVPEKREKF